MKYYAIAPLNNLESIREFDHYMVIGSFLEVRDYFKFYRQRRKEGAVLILDNGAFEKGAPMDEKEYMKWISKLQPQRVVLPDVYDDVGRSVEIGLKFLMKAERVLGDFFNRIDWIAALHGMEIESLNYEYARYSQNGVTTLAIPYKHWKYSADRPMIARMIPRRKMFNVHFLGLRGIEEFMHIKPGMVDSIDTSYPWKVAQGLKKLDWEMKMEEAQVEEAIQGMIDLKKKCEQVG